MNVSDAIRLKRAVRKFTPEPLTEATIRAILNAGRRAQSSKNTQPWHFIAITDKAILKQLSECGEWAGHLAGAALGVAIIHPDPGEKFQIHVRYWPGSGVHAAGCLGVRGGFLPGIHLPAGACP
jgi:nitroreductase